MLGMSQHQSTMAVNKRKIRTLLGYFVGYWCYRRKQWWHGCVEGYCSVGSASDAFTERGAREKSEEDVTNEQKEMGEVQYFRRWGAAAGALREDAIFVLDSLDEELATAPTFHKICVYASSCEPAGWNDAHISPAHSCLHVWLCLLLRNLEQSTLRVLIWLNNFRRPRTFNMQVQTKNATSHQAEFQNKAWVLMLTKQLIQLL